MIFVTVGSADPFDRLVRAVDVWAGLRGRADVFVQVGRSDYQPEHIEVVQFLDPSEFRDRVRSSRFVVSHAGMGSIITALELGKPIVVMPRRAHLGETRNDHQVSTVNHLKLRPGIIVATDEQELFLKLDQAETTSTTSPISAEASPLLISTVRDFIEGIQTIMPLKSDKKNRVPDT